MGLKTSFTSEAEAVEALKAARPVERDGKWVVDVEGMVTKADLDAANVKLVEFRDNNRALNAEVTELRPLKDKFKDVDPEEYKTLKANTEKLKNKGVKDPDDLAAAIKAAVEAAVNPIATKLSMIEKSDAEKTIALARKDFEGQLTQSALKAGVDETMLPHFLRHGLDTFRFDDGKFVPKRGDVPIYSTRKPTELVTVDEWVNEQPFAAPGFFKPSSGGGASGNVGRSGPTGRIRTMVIPPGEPIRLSRDDEKAVASGELVIQRQ